MIHRYVFQNEELVAVEKARWSPGQAGLICGWGLFTTVRIVRGEAFAYERHWRRLEKDAALTRLSLTYTGARVRVHLQEVIRANKVEEGCARIYLVWNTVFDNTRVTSELGKRPVPFSQYSYPLLKFSREANFTYRYQAWPEALPRAS